MLRDLATARFRIQISESVRGRECVYHPIHRCAIQRQPYGTSYHDGCVAPLFSFQYHGSRSLLWLCKTRPQSRSSCSDYGKTCSRYVRSAGIDRVVTIDLHAGQIQGFFNIPVDNLYGSVTFENYIRSKNLKNPIIASPDIGGVARARYFASRMGLDMVIVDKRREKANESEVMNIIGNVEGKDVIMIDDMVDTAGTMVKAATALKNKGATSVMACATHGVLSGKAYENLENGELDELIVTNTLVCKPHNKIIVLTVAPLFAEVIRRVYHNESVNSLFA